MGLEETNILFIEDDMAACKSLPPILKSYGFKVNTANTFTYELTKGNTAGSICEIYDSTDPSTGKGAFAQAWSVSEVFRILFDNTQK